MPRRRVIVIVSAVVLLLLGGLVGGFVLSVTQTRYGREKVRSLVESRIRPKVKGRIHIGNITGSFYDGLTIDSLEITDDEDSLLVRTGPITLEWDPRDLLDKRLLIKRLEVLRPVAYLRQHEDYSWNYRRAFNTSKGPPKPKPRVGERGWGDFIVIDSAVVRDGRFLLTQPWHPSDSLQGARRDSAIAVNVARTDRVIRPRRERGKASDDYAQTFSWSNLQAVLGYARLSDPDSVGRAFDIANISVDEFFPPLKVVRGRARVRQLGDSVWLDVPHFALPGSTGRAGGKVVWGSEMPVRYDVRIVGDSVSMSDVAWVYGTLPRTGGGRMNLHIRNQGYVDGRVTNRRRLNVIDYAIGDMDIRAADSRLLGDMTFGVGDTVLIVKDLDLRAEPADFELLHTLNGKPLPYPWAGQIYGTVRGRGGPVNRFVIDESRFTFRDANVPGAQARGTAKGELDILFPAFTVFRGFDVALERFDLATIRFLNPSFPELNGQIAGRATLDSSWLDVRFSRADLTHADGPGDASRFLGSGRVTYGERLMTYDLTLDAPAIAFTTLARSYPNVPIRGTYHGTDTLRIAGTIEDLALSGALAGPGGRLSADGRFGFFYRTPGLEYPDSAAVHDGVFTTTDLDLRTLLENPKLPATSLTTRWRAELEGDSLSTLAGAVALELDRSVVDSVLLRTGRARLRFADGRVHVDTFALQSPAASLRASGGLGLRASRRDSLAFSLYVDSLGGLRRYLRPSVAAADPEAAPDSLAGTLRAEGALVGSVDTLQVLGTVAGRELAFGTTRAERLTGSWSLSDVLRAPRGVASLELDSVLAGGVRLRSAGLGATVRGRDDLRLTAAATSTTGQRLSAGADVRLAGDTTTAVLDSVALSTGESEWRLEAPATVVAHTGGAWLDRLTMRSDRRGVLSLRARLPVADAIEVVAEADSLSLSELGRLAQATQDSIGGTARLGLTMGGTRRAPTMRVDAEVAAARWGSVRIETVRGTGGYADRRLSATLDVFRGGERALAAEASLPLDLALEPVARRLLPDSLRGSVRTDRVELGIVETLTPAITSASGSLTGQVVIGGTWERMVLSGSLAVADGAMSFPALGSVRLRGLAGAVRFTGDSVVIDTLRARSAHGNERGGQMFFGGRLDLADRENPGFDLAFGGNRFHAIGKPRVADIDVTTRLRLRGRLRGSELSGGITLDRGDIFIPELAQKKLVSLEDEDVYKVVDTTVFANKALLPARLPAQVDTMLRYLALEARVDLGEDVWLRSAEADIKLGGFLFLRPGSSDRANAKIQPALNGTLVTERGRYRLNLGLVRRTFEVEAGTVQFFGDPDLNPTLDINASYVVRATRQGSDLDVPIRLRISGPLYPQPQLEITSGDNVQRSQSDLLSYLITGQPSLTISASREGNINTFQQVVLPSLGSYFANKLNFLGLDYLDVQTSSVKDYRDLTRSYRSGATSLLEGTRLGGGFSIGRRTFVNVDFGLCEVARSVVGSSAQFDPDRFYKSIGMRVERRLDPEGQYSLSAGIEPATNVLTCSANSSTFFLPPVRQFGFDLTRKWEF